MFLKFMVLLSPKPISIRKQLWIRETVGYEYDIQSNRYLNHGMPQAVEQYYTQFIPFIEFARFCY